MAPETTMRTGSQKGRTFEPSARVVDEIFSCTHDLKCAASNHPGASEISDACKPLKKRSRASTDVEMASSQYRDTSDSDSRGLSDPQVFLEMRAGMKLKVKLFRKSQKKDFFSSCHLTFATLLRLQNRGGEHNVSEQGTENKPEF